MSKNRNRNKKNNNAKVIDEAKEKAIIKAEEAKIEAEEPEAEAEEVAAEAEAAAGELPEADDKTETKADTAPKKKKKKPKTEEELKRAEEKKKRIRKKKIREAIRSFIFCVSLGAFVFAATGLLVIFWGYYTSEKEYEEINDKVVIGTVESSEKTSSAAKAETDSDGEVVPIETEAPNLYIPIQVDEEYYKAVNSDYVCYIYVPGTSVRYPVVQSPEREYYLRYTFRGTENMAGAISIDYRTDRKSYFEAFNIIISGHNRQDGTMFSDMTKYENKLFRDANPYIYIVKGDKEYVYEIFACYLSDPVSPIFNPNTAEDVYISIIEESNIYKNMESITKADKIITLYTCNEDSSKRYLIHGKLKAVYDN